MANDFRFQTGTLRQHLVAWFSGHLLKSRAGAGDYFQFQPSVIRENALTMNEVNTFRKQNRRALKSVQILERTDEEEHQRRITTQNHTRLTQGKSSQCHVEGVLKNNPYTRVASPGYSAVSVRTINFVERCAMNHEFEHRQ